MSQLRDLLLETAARLFAEAAEPELQEAVEQGRFPEAMWREIEENGLPAALVPEAAGGAGLQVADAMAILRLAGSFALPVPLAETLLARLVLSRVGLEAPGGPLGLMLGDPGRALRSTGEGEGLLLSGPLALPWPGAVRNAVAVAASEEEDRPLAALMRDVQVAGEVRRNLAGEPVARVGFGRHAVAKGDWRPLPVDLDRPAVLRLAAAARTQMMAGAMERILELVLEHAHGRVQFGRPIARFQAVQHLAARLAAEVAAVGVAADAAVAALEAGDGSFQVAAAKARAGEAATEVAKIAHQVHGAIGYTREHVLHRFTRRLWTWRDDFGDEGYWQGEVGATALAAGGDGLWDLLCR